jgi:hypothetical protein
VQTNAQTTDDGAKTIFPLSPGNAPAKKHIRASPISPRPSALALPGETLPFKAKIGLYLVRPPRHHVMSQPNATPTLSLVLIVFLGLCSCSHEPSANQIKADLVGQRVESPTIGWRFSSPSEFQRFDVADKQTTADVVEYAIAVRVADANGPADGILHVSYRNTDSGWKFLTVTADDSFFQSLKRGGFSTMSVNNIGSGKEAYIGEWRQLRGGGTMTISDNGSNVAVIDEHGQTFTATLDKNGDLQTSIMVKMSIVKETGHLVWINGEYERTRK